MNTQQFYVDGQVRKTVKEACGQCAVRFECALSEILLDNVVDMQGHQAGLSQKQKIEMLYAR